MSRNVRIEGKFVILDELQTKYFKYIIKWRNDPELTRYLNQPFKLTMELQTKWYEEKYLNDKSQGLFVMIDKATNVPFGTLGWTDWDEKSKVCIEGRALVGNPDFRGSKEMTEGYLLLNEYVYETLGVKNVYIHVVNDNKKVISLNKRWGFHEHDGEPKYPHELFVNGMHQTEYVRTYDEYKSIKEKIENILQML